VAGPTGEMRHTGSPPRSTMNSSPFRATRVRTAAKDLAASVAEIVVVLGMKSDYQTDYQSPGKTRVHPALRTEDDEAVLERSPYLRVGGASAAPADSVPGSDPVPVIVRRVFPPVRPLA